MIDILNAILPYLVKLVGVVVGLLICYVSNKFKKYLDEKLKTETARNLVATTVRYIEQVFKDIHGKEKLDRAKNTLIKLLANKGIVLTDEEIEILIESAVNTMNNKKED